MKRFIYILFLMLLTLAMGCDPDSKEKIVKSPRVYISLDSEIPAAVYPGTVLEFSFSLQSANGIKSVYATADGNEIDGTAAEFEDMPESATVSFSYTPSDTYSGNTIDFAVVAQGGNGAKGHYDYPVFILASKPKVHITLPPDAPNEFLVDGSTLSFNISISSESVDISRVTTYKGDSVIPGMSFDVSGDPRNITLPFSYTPTLGETGSPTVFTFEVMDVNGNLVSADYSVTFYKQASTELNERSGIVLGANKCITAGQFFDAITGTVYEANGVGAHCADIDFTIFWSNNAGTNGIAFASPNASNVTVIYPAATIVDVLGGTESDIPQNWTVRNETNFRELTLTADSFAAVSTSAEVRSLFDSGTAPSNDHVTFQKVAGSVLAFKINRSGSESEPGIVKYGLLRVTSRPATNNAGTIVFDYKIEK